MVENADNCYRETYTIAFKAHTRGDYAEAVVLEKGPNGDPLVVGIITDREEAYDLYEYLTGNNLREVCR